MAYDDSRGVAVVFSGANDQETWEWNPITGAWTDRTTYPIPSSWPVGRSESPMAFDSDRHTAFVFGSQQGLARDLWEWDGATGTWLDWTPSPLPASWPPYRSGHAMVYDAARKRLFLFGGENTTVALNDAWERDQATGVWTNLTPPSVLPSAWPAPRGGHAMVYDNARQRVLLVGGVQFRSGPSGLLQDTWEWNGTTKQWLQVANQTGPSGRGGHAMAYYAPSGTTLLFGGQQSGTAQLDDTWEWDPVASTWNKLAPTAFPPKRSFHRMVYEQGRDRIVLFGGVGPSAMNDVWEWSW
jgi:N-acetylneuraminic acid mutarotase